MGRLLAAVWCLYASRRCGIGCVGLAQAATLLRFAAQRSPKDQGAQDNLATIEEMLLEAKQ